MPEATIPDIPFEEEWRVIEEFPDYEISSFARIRRTRPSACGYDRGFVLKPTARQGRNKVTLHYFGKIGRRVFVDELIATTFYGPRPSTSHIVEHVDRDKLNDHQLNVRWQLPPSMHPDGFEWRLIPGFSCYQIREDGVIRRVKPDEKGRTNRIGHTIRTQSFGKYGHLTVFLIDDHGVKHGHTVHHLMCWAYHGPRPSCIHQAAHNDGNTGHNHWTNVRWATPQENADDKIIHGTNRAGEINPRAILSASDVMAIRKELAADNPRTYQQIGKQYNVSKSAIGYLNKDGWKSIPCFEDME